jgi:hypothetical protein
VTQGTSDTTPVFSVEGDRVAFERDDRIVVKELASGAERVVAEGVYPFWGGKRTVPVRLARTLAAAALRRGAAVRVRCAGGCRVRATLRVTHTTGRRLGLGRSRTIARAPRARKGAGTVRLRLRATRKAAPRLGRLRSYPATVHVTTRPRSGGAATSAAEQVRVRR